MLLAVQVEVGDEAFEVGDLNGILHELAAARRLARMRADATDGGGQRDALFNETQRLLILAVGDQTHVALAIGARGARQRAGRLAVARVVGQQHIQRETAGTDHALRLGVDDHVVADFGGAGAQQLRDALRFDHAQTARAVSLDALIVAEGRNVDAVGTGRFQNGRAGGCLDAHPVNGDVKLFSHDSFPPYLFSTAPKRQTSIQLPHLMHLLGSMTNGFLISPLMAFAGHFLLQREQPLHLSALMLY